MRVYFSLFLGLWISVLGMLFTGCEPEEAPRMPDPSGLRSASNPFTKPNKGWSTEFHMAAYNGDEAALDEMIRHGGNATFKDSEENEPLDYLVQSELIDMKTRIRILHKLVKHGADVNLPASRSRATPLHHVALCSMVEMTRALCELGANPNARDVAGWTPLHQAAGFYHGKNSRDLSDILIEYGADPLARTRDGETILDVIHPKAKESPEAREYFGKLMKAAATKKSEKPKPPVQSAPHTPM